MREHLNAPEDDVPSCPSSTDCLRLLDEILRYDAAASQHAAPPAVEVDDPHEQRRIVQLAQHLKTCPICSVRVAREHVWRDQLRQALKGLLAEGEHVVPATTAQIMAQVSRETAALRPVGRISQPQQVPLAVYPLATPAERRVRSRIFVPTLVAVALILLALGALAQLASLHPTLSQHREVGPTPVTLASSPGTWSSVVGVRSSIDGRQQVIENIDPVTGKQVPLFLHCCASGIIVDGVSHHGTNVLFHSVTGQQTTYHLLSGQSYTFAGQSSNAVWTTDDSVLYVNTVQGVVQLTVATGRQQRLPWTLNASRLAFYRNDFLYFLRTLSAQSYELDRVNVLSGVQNMVVQHASSSTFWLDLSGDTTYYMQNDGGQRDLYAVGSDGSAPRLLHTAATPIGYATDGSLIVIQEQQGIFQVVQLGETVQQDTTLVPSLAPGATSLCADQGVSDGVPTCDSSIALAPYASTLVVGAAYADGSYRVWSIDLQTSGAAPRELFQLTGQERVRFQLVGWDTLLTR